MGGTYDKEKSLKEVRHGEQEARAMEVVHEEDEIRGRRRCDLAHDKAQSRLR